jgi:hypothetical protein
MPRNSQVGDNRETEGLVSSMVGVPNAISPGIGEWRSDDRELLLAIADPPEAADDLLFNAGSPEVKLRNDFCRRNVFHTLLKPIKTLKVDRYPWGVAFPEEHAPK